MLEAFTRGKATLSEDLLTSLAFGLLAHREGALEDFLRRCRTIHQEAPLAHPDLTIASVDLWPSAAGFGEPDVVVRGAIGSRPLTVVVEAKLGASKSQWDEEPEQASAEAGERRDQLARYWRAWERGAFGAHRAGELCLVVYLTAHMSAPLDELRESLEAAPGASMAWLSWGDLLPVLGASIDASPMFAAVGATLAGIIEARGLGPFVGFAGRSEPHIDASRWWFDEGGFACAASPTVVAERVWIFDPPGEERG
ncbi:MAG: hypothetical protein M5U28_39020 [Sandaracinaceae bacterium]|nr:hypothetical protein [Sandaracinaceae bacterium]